jgi:hypothetical protein
MEYLDLLQGQFNNQVRVYEKRPGIIQLIVPLYHEDGDMVDIFLEEAKDAPGRVRVCDYGMTLMRLSYDFDLNSPNKERVFQQILAENAISEDDGNLFIETAPEGLYPAILQFAQGVAKVSNMQVLKREMIRSLFYEEFGDFVQTGLSRYNPQGKYLPLPDRDDLEVDYLLNSSARPVFLFAAKDATKARLVTISCLEFRQHKLPFKGFVVHEDFGSLPRKDQVRVTSAADKQFPSLLDFREYAVQFVDAELVPARGRADA